MRSRSSVNTIFSQQELNLREQRESKESGRGLCWTKTNHWRQPKRVQTYYFPGYLFTGVQRQRGRKPRIGVVLYRHGDERGGVGLVGDGEYGGGKKGLVQSVAASALLL